MPDYFSIISPKKGKKKVNKQWPVSGGKKQPPKPKAKRGAQ